MPDRAIDARGRYEARLEASGGHAEADEHRMSRIYLRDLANRDADPGKSSFGILLRERVSRRDFALWHRTGS
jgi:hypothetical protein